eukprot:227952-Ditylum_brightwellii.AAC.1
MDQMEAMMQQLLTTKEQNHCPPPIMAQFLTPSSEMIHYQNTPYTQILASNQPMTPPLQPMHMQKPLAAIGNFHQQQHPQQQFSPTTGSLSSQGSLDYQREHLTQNYNVEHKMDLIANRANK